jgi:hypothetical protein
MIRLFRRRSEEAPGTHEAESEMRPLASDPANDAPAQSADYLPWNPDMMSEAARLELGFM